MATGPHSNEYQITQFVLSDTLYNWFLKTNTDLIGKLNRLYVYTAQGSTGIDASTSTGGVLDISLGATIPGNHTFTGDITFNGTITTINSLETTVDDYNLVLGHVDGGGGTSDTQIGNSGGGGIIVRGMTQDKEFLWKPDASGTTNLSAWNTNQNIRFASQLAFFADDDYLRFRGKSGGVYFRLERGTTGDNAYLGYGFSGGATLDLAKLGQDGYVKVFNGANNKRVGQTGHGFTFGTVVRYDATISGYTAAKANNAENAEVIGVVSAVNGNTFDITFLGEIFGNFSGVQDGGGSTLAPGFGYFLSGTTAGNITGTPPTTTDYIRKPVLISTGTGSALVVHYIGAVNVDEETLTSGSSTQKFFFTPAAGKTFEVGTAVRVFDDTETATTGQEYGVASSATDEESEAVGIITAKTSSNSYEVTITGIDTFSNGLTLDNGIATAIEPGVVYYLSNNGTGRLTTLPPDSNPNIIKPVGIGMVDDRLLILSRNGFGVTDPSSDNANLLGKTFVPSARGTILPYATVTNIEFQSWQGDKPGSADSDPSVFIMGWHQPDNISDPNESSALAAIKASNVLYDTVASFGSETVSDPDQWLAYNVNLELDLFEDVPGNASHVMVNISADILFRQNSSGVGLFGMHTGRYFNEGEGLPNFYDRDSGDVESVLDYDVYGSQIRSFVTKDYSATNALELSSGGIAANRNVETTVLVPLTRAACEDDDATAYNVFTILSRLTEVASADIRFKVVGYLTDLDSAAFPSPYGSRRNKAYNGNFFVAQRGNTFSYTGTAEGYNFDRWLWRQACPSNAVTEITRPFVDSDDAEEGLPSNVYRYAKFDLTPQSISTAQILECFQIIPAVRELKNGPATLSFWARSGISGMKLNLGFARHYNSSASEVGGQSADFISVGLCQLSTEWAKYEFSFDAPDIRPIESTYGRNAIHIIFGCGNAYTTGDTTQANFLTMLDSSVSGAGFWPSGNGSVDIAQVQLEEGGRATQFEFRNSRDEEELCSRFYQRSYDPNKANGAVTQEGAERMGGPFHSVRFPYPMQAGPNGVTIAFWSTNGQTGYGSINENTSADQTLVIVDNTASNNGFQIKNSTAANLLTQSGDLTAAQLTSLAKNSYSQFHWAANAEHTF